MKEPKLNLSPFCSRKGCNKLSIYQVCFTIQPLDGRPPIMIQTSLTVCREHKLSMHIEDILSNDIKVLCTAVMKRVDGILDPTSYKLVFQPI